MVYVTVKNKVDYLMTWEMLQNIVEWQKILN